MGSGAGLLQSQQPLPSVLLQSVIQVFSAGARPYAGPGDLDLNQVSFVF